MADQQTATTATTGIIRVNGVVGFSVDSSLDEDWFRVAGLVAGHSYRIELVGASSGLGTLADPLIGGVYTSAGALIAGTTADDIAAPFDLDARLQFTPTSSGTYFIEAGSAIGLSTGSYVLAITDLDAPDAPADAGTTQTVVVGSTGLQGEIDAVGDVDWYGVSLVAGQTYRVTVTGIEGLGGTLSDPMIRGIHQGGALLPFSGNDDSGGTLNSRVDFVAAVTGIYYVDVSAYPGATGTYRLAVQNVTPADIPGGIGSAATLAVNAGQPVQSALGGGGDADWFRVTLTAGVTYCIEGLGLATGHGSLADPRISGIYNAAGVLVGAGNDDGGLGLNARTFFTPTLTGTYFVGIDDPRGTDVPGSYRVSVRTTTAYDVPASTGSVAEAVVGGSVLGTVGSAGDVDWFRAVLLPGHVYQIDLQGYANAADGTALADTFLRGIYNDVGTLIDGTSNDDYGGALGSRVVYTSGGGPVFIAAGAYGTGTGNYRLDVTDVTPTDIAASTATTAALALNAQRSGRIELAGDEDWFRVTLTAGLTYVIDLVGNPGSASGLPDPYFSGIRDSAGTLVPGTVNDDWADSFDSHVTYRPTVSGTYYLGAAGYGTATGDYVISLTRVVNIVDAVSNDTGTTGALAPGGSVTGRIDVAFDEDWYRVTLTAGQAYVIDLRGQPSGNGTLVDPLFDGVRNAAGVLVAGTPNDDVPGSLDSQSVFTPTTTGTYYLAARGYGSGVGTYTLSIATTSTGSDVAANVTTTASVPVGGSTTGTVNFAGDVDWVRVNVTAGGHYVVDLRGAPSGNGTLGNPEILGIFSGAGAALASSIEADAISPASLNSHATFTSGYTGAAYIAVQAQDGGTGSYRLSVATQADTTAPTLFGASPADNATGIATTANITLTFSEAVKAGLGNITVSGGAQTQVIAVTDTAKVAFSGSTMTINPAANLLAGTAYTVTFGNGVVEDLAGNDFAGIAGNPVNFTTLAQAPADKWTIMVYVDGDNNLESFALGDINEMESVAGLNALGVNVMVMADRISGYSNASGNWTDTRRGQVVPDADPNLVTTLNNAASSVGEKNMGSAATLTEFINWAKTTAPAQNYALVIWDHGGGLNGAAWDDTGGDNLTLAEIRAGVDNSSVARFDLIGFDCCQMAMAEMAFALRDLTDVFVASEENEPGDGWDYAAVLNAIKGTPTMSDVQLGSAIVNAYGAQYAGTADTTLSALTTAQLGAVDTALDGFVAQALAASAADRTAMSNAALAAVQFPSDGGAPWRDVVDFMEEVMARTATVALDNAAQAVINAVRAAVYARTGTVPDAEGLSINLPTDGAQADYTAANYSFLNAVAWDDLLAIL